MGTRDKRVDAYIGRSADFAKPILTHIRDTVHEACPDCEETLKWSMPTFMYHGMLCGMAAFKEHASLGFWKHELLLGKRDGEGMGSFGRITSVEDLPAKRQLVALIKRAMKLNEAGVTVPRVRQAARKAAIPVVPEFEAALAKHKKARTTFDSLAPSHRREYVEWIAEAKRAETRARRVATAIDLITAGKPRNWKYMKER